MDKILYGQTILIGRDPSQSRLCVSVGLNGNPYMACIGNPQSVPSTVSRCIPKEGTAHCSIDVDEKGRMMLRNLKENNVTLVNGNEVITKFVGEGDRVVLGRGGYEMSLAEVLATAEKIVAKVEGVATGGSNSVMGGAGGQKTSTTKPPQKEFSIAHLEEVRNTFEQEKEKNQKGRKLDNLLLRVPMLLSSVGGVVTGLAKANNDDGLGNGALVFTIISCAVMIYGIIRALNSPYDKKDKENVKWFKENYVCPNPECDLPLTNYDFDILKKRGKCPFCGCKHTT